MHCHPRSLASRSIPACPPRTSPGGFRYPALVAGSLRCPLVSRASGFAALGAAGIEPAFTDIAPGPDDGTTPRPHVAAGWRFEALIAGRVVAALGGWPNTSAVWISDLEARPFRGDSKRCNPAPKGDLRGSRVASGRGGASHDGGATSEVLAELGAGQRRCARSGRTRVRHPPPEDAPRRARDRSCPKRSDRSPLWSPPAGRGACTGRSSRT